MPSHTVEERKKKRKDTKRNLNISEEQLQESEQREKTAQARLTEREKLASRTGVSSKRAGKILEPGFAQEDALRQEELEIERSKGGAIQELETVGAFEEVTPTTTDLSSPAGSDIPVIGSALKAVSQTVPNRSVLGTARESGLFSNTLPLVRTGEDAFPIPETPETLREAALREISIKSFKKGLSRDEKFGTMVESIPIVGNRARAWASGLISQPSDNVKEVINNVNKIREDASTGQEKVRNGLEDPDFGLDNARRMEANLAELEGRIQLLIDSSPVLQANPDRVNTLQEQIFEAQEKVARYRTASTFGLTAQLTGTGRIIPTDEMMFFELKRLNGGTTRTTESTTQTGETSQGQSIGSKLLFGSESSGVQQFTVPIGSAKKLAPAVISKFKGIENVPAIFEKVSKFPTITKQLLRKGNSKAYDEVGRFTDKGLKALESFLKS